MTHRIRIAAAAGVLFILGLAASPAQAAVDTSRPCDDVNDVDCTMTVVQVRPGAEATYLRSINGGEYVPFVLEGKLQADLSQCRQIASTVVGERDALSSEAQDLRPRLAVAESDAREAHADLVAAERRIHRQADTIRRLRERLSQQ